MNFDPHPQTNRQNPLHALKVRVMLIVGQERVVRFRMSSVKDTKDFPVRRWNK
jgi:hypothetical protein